MKIFNSFIIITMLALAVPVTADTFDSRFEVAARYAREAMLYKRHAHDSNSNCCSDSNCCSNSECCCSNSESNSESTPDNTYDSGGGSSYHGSSGSSHNNSGSPRRGWGSR